MNSVNFLLFLCVYKAVRRAAVLQMETTFVSFLSGAERKATVAHIQPRGKWTTKEDIGFLFSCENDQPSESCIQTHSHNLFTAGLFDL